MSEIKPVVGCTAMHNNQRVGLSKREWFAGDPCVSWFITSDRKYVLETELSAFRLPSACVSELIYEKLAPRKRTMQDRIDYVVELGFTALVNQLNETVGKPSHINVKVEALDAVFADVSLQLIISTLYTRMDISKDRGCTLRAYYESTPIGGVTAMNMTLSVEHVAK
jgi:hypothetical protein